MAKAPRGMPCSMEEMMEGKKPKGGKKPLPKTKGKKKAPLFK